MAPNPASRPSGGLHVRRPRRRSGERERCRRRRRRCGVCRSTAGRESPAFQSTPSHSESLRVICHFRVTCAPRPPIACVHGRAHFFPPPPASTHTLPTPFPRTSPCPLSPGRDRRRSVRLPAPERSKRPVTSRSAKLEAGRAGSQAPGQTDALITTKYCHLPGAEAGRCVNNRDPVIDPRRGADAGCPLWRAPAQANRVETRRRRRFWRRPFGALVGGVWYPWSGLVRGSRVCNPSADHGYGDPNSSEIAACPRDRDLAG